MAARRVVSPRGFSLLEVLVAVTLFAIICTVLYSGFAMVTRSWRRGHENIQQSERLRSVFELIRRQIISIYPVVPVEEDIESAQAQPGPQRMVAAKIPYFVGSDQQVAFVTLFSLRFQRHPRPLLRGLWGRTVPQRSDGVMAVIETVLALFPAGGGWRWRLEAISLHPARSSGGDFNPDLQARPVAGQRRAGRGTGRQCLRMEDR